MKYSTVTCGECHGNTVFVVCEWPPSFFWCRYCKSVFTFSRTIHTNEAIWQLRGYPQS